jgi:polygalacturonase
LPGFPADDHELRTGPWRMLGTRAAVAADGADLLLKAFSQHAHGCRLAHAVSDHEGTIIGTYVSEFGAVGDGRADDSAAVQAAIDAAHGDGGGRVVLAAGHSYRCGSIELKSHIELHLEPGSRLVAATRIEEFSRRVVVGALAGGVSAHSDATTAALIWALDASDVSITGSGVVDGSAHAYVAEPGSQIHRMTNARPFPVFLIGCTRVTITGVRFVDSALWTVRLSGCHVVEISAIRIDNDMRVPNADGIDLDHCTRVQVIGCDIRCPDDGISLKTTDEFLGYGPTEDVVISSCTIESMSTAITLGVDAERPIRNVVVTGCVCAIPTAGCPCR